MSVFRTSASENLVKDIKSVVASAESILQATADQTGGEIAHLRGTMVMKLAAAKHQVLAIEDALASMAKQVVKDTDDYVNANPWQTSLVAGVAGLLIGYLLSARRH